MDLVQPKTLQELLVALLARTSAAPAIELQRKMAAQKRHYSLPGIYKELNKLREQGVVLKQGKEFRLSLTWVLNLLEMADVMYESQVGNLTNHSLLPPPDTSYTFNFHTLPRLDDFWIHIIVLMTQASKSRYLYQWIPHPWFHLIQVDKTRPFQEAIKAGGGIVKSIIGGETSLDIESSQRTLPGSYEFFYAQGPFEGERQQYISVSGNYLMVIKLDLPTAQIIDGIYNSYASALAIPTSEITLLARMKIKGKVRISNSGRTAEKYLKKFRDYFGD
ncbi:MAG: hypothetical protein KDD69_18810 [Bdellovibrionales bacterium]|nr:hypothetical protein [Bdellovibrionales bacterium]